MKTQTKSKKFEGQCKFCGQDFSKRQIAAHLAICEKRENEKTGNIQGLMLGIYDSYLKDFWLIAETNKTAKLKDLDQLIRDVWVECCGHLSLFGNYGREISKNKIIFDTLRPGDNLPYIYDFGSSTELVIKVLGYTNYKIGIKNPVELVARNYLPQASCIECGRQALYVCTECGDEQMPFLCEKCIKKHDEDKGCYLLPIANSPRSGVCGYESPKPLEQLF